MSLAQATLVDELPDSGTVTSLTHYTEAKLNNIRSDASSLTSVISSLCSPSSRTHSASEMRTIAAMLENEATFLRQDAATLEARR